MSRLDDHAVKTLLGLANDLERYPKLWSRYGQPRERSIVRVGLLRRKKRRQCVALHLWDRAGGIASAESGHLVERMNRALGYDDGDWSWHRVYRWNDDLDTSIEEVVFTLRIAAGATPPPGKPCLAKA